MVKDAFSENGSGLPPAADGLIPQTQSESAQAPAANLTELAQLLAASIAQTQAGKGRTGMPTNAELTSLANLVSAAQADSARWRPYSRMVFPRSPTPRRARAQGAAAGSARYGSPRR